MDEQMHAALDVDIPNYATAIVTAAEIVDSIASIGNIDQFPAVATSLISL